MTDKQIDEGYEKYLKIDVSELKRLFPRYPPIFAGEVGVDLYPGSDHDGEIIDYVYQENHRNLDWIVCWLMDSQEHRDWWVSLTKE